MNRAHSEANIGSLTCDPPGTGARLISRVCNVCGCDDQDLLGVMEGKLIATTFNLVSCRSCKFVFVNPCLAPQCLVDLYSQEYYRGQGFDPAATYLKDDGRLQSHKDYSNHTLALKIDSAARRVSVRGRSFLDVGCGLGELLVEMQKLHYRVQGVEASPFALHVCRKAGLQVVETREKFCTLFPPESFDIISMIEVIEHLPFPRQAIQSAAHLLKPGGMLFVQTGNVEHAFNPIRRLGSVLRTRLEAPLSRLRPRMAWANLIRECSEAFVPLSWSYFSPEGHVSYFSPSTLAKVYRDCGLETRYLNRYAISGLKLPVAIKPLIGGKRLN